MRNSFKVRSHDIDTFRVRAMSFPRKVPLAKRKVNYKLRNRVLGSGIVYTIGCGLAFEYFGLLDKYVVDINRPDAQSLVERTQVEDEKTWQKWSMKMLDRSMEKSRRMMNDNFVESLPIGVQNFINDPK